MRSPSACERRALGGLVLLAIAGLAPAAQADDKKVCADAYAQTQELRQAGQLQSARDQARICLRDACPEFIRADCASWLAQLDASVPTVVFDVKDAAGATTTDAMVELDGKPWLQRSDVRAHPIDPGTHTLRFSLPGSAPQEQQLVVREGEKSKLISVRLVPAAAPPSDVPPLAPTAAPAEEAPSSGPGLAPWIIGGSGVALVAVGAILGIVVIGERSTYDEHCDDVTGCDAEALAARDTGETLGPISTVAMVLGGVGVGVGVVWLAVGGDDDGAAATLRTGASISADGASLRLRRAF